MNLAAPPVDALQFRDADLADVPTVVGLVESAYRGESSRRGWTTEADLLDGIRIAPEVLFEQIGRPRSVVRLAEHAGGEPHLLACAHVEAKGGSGYFGMFAVHPALQDSGIGKALLADAERLVREDWRLPRMRMTVIDLRAELIAFYQRRGYRRTGVRQPFPYGDPRFGLPKRDDLRFEVLEKQW